MLASIIGPAGVTSDIAVLRTLYTDADLMAQYNQWSATSKMMAESFLRGMNARFSQLISGAAPLPAQFTLLGVSP